MNKTCILVLCHLLIIMAVVQSQPYASWTKQELKLNNGIVERVITLPGVKGKFSTILYKPVVGSFEFFDSAGAQYTGSGDSDLVAANVKTAVAFENLSITGSYVATLVCPTGWIKVPGDSAYGTNDFCVMKSA